ncbi:MAG: alpha/beta hydrolase, partial [Planctomycetota bacterium]
SAGWVIYRPYAPDNPDPDIAYHWWKYENNIEAVLAVVEHAKTNYNIDINRIYLAGFSGGASTTSIVGRAHGEVFAACGMHCGLPMGSSTSARKAPYYVYCGASDQMYTLYPYVADDLEAAGHEVEYLVGPTGHTPYQTAFDANWQFFQTHTLN